eukprot:TRINITY_DN81_c0_g2_i1.p2 TRINITY_DN81_c0_g2~~TRINITY_DN81_c0_g2_i1.p2  ORF type:complete len:864 (-),score=113.19 TRINITY_DN81_c0_g2_i1:40278-42869(-)
MSKFNVGDRVRCINNKDWEGVLNINGEHTVKSVSLLNPGEIFIDNTTGSWREDRFELVAKFKTGDPVLCVNGSTPELEASRIYLVKSVSDGGAIVVNGKPWNPSRFVASTMDDFRLQDYKNAEIRSHGAKWYIHNGLHLYMNEAGGFYSSMQAGQGTYFSTKELAQAALDRARGVTIASDSPQQNATQEQPCCSQPADGGGSEKQIVSRFVELCQPSLSPDKYEAVIVACEMLCNTRKNLKGCFGEISGASSVSSEPPKPTRPFQVGDTVICRDTDGCSGMLRMNQAYEVAYIYKEMGRIDFNGINTGRCGWNTSRFVLAKEAGKPADPVKPTPDLPVNSFVRCVNCAPHGGFGNAVGLNVNRIYQVAKSLHCFICVAGDKDHWHKNRFVPATLTEYQQQCIADTGFKIGDKVMPKVRQDGYDGGSFTVCGFSFNGSKMEGMKLREHDFAIFNPSEFELVPEKPKQQFKPGDRVTCVDDTDMMNITKGREYIVADVIKNRPHGLADSVSLRNAGDGDKTPYESKRFEIAPPLTTGERLLCIDGGGGVEFGNVYTARSNQTMRFSGAFIDAGVHNGECYADRFVRLPKTTVFSVGSYVRCIDKGSICGEFGDLSLVLHRVYKVRDNAVDEPVGQENCIYLEGEKCCWNKSRFVTATESDYLAQFPTCAAVDTVPKINPVDESPNRGVSPLFSMLKGLQECNFHNIRFITTPPMIGHFHVHRQRAKQYRDEMIKIVSEQSDRKLQAEIDAKFSYSWGLSQDHQLVRSTKVQFFNALRDSYRIAAISEADRNMETAFNNKCGHLDSDSRITLGYIDLKDTKRVYPTTPESYVLFHKVAPPTIGEAESGVDFPSGCLNPSTYPYAMK